MRAMLILIVYLAAVNLTAFVCYGVDKYKAVHHKWRISEATLLTLAWIGGGVGAAVGMAVFHHKTRKWKFRVMVPVAVVVWVIAGYWIWK